MAATTTAPTPMALRSFTKSILNLSTALAGEEAVGAARLSCGNDSDMTILSSHLDDRATVANKLGAKIFVSIHYNSAPSEEAEGLEVFYYEDEDNTSRLTQSKLLAQIRIRSNRQTHRGKISRREKRQLSLSSARQRCQQY